MLTLLVFLIDSHCFVDCYTMYPYVEVCLSLYKILDRSCIYIIYNTVIKNQILNVDVKLLESLIFFTNIS